MRSGKRTNNCFLSGTLKQLLNEEDETMILCTWIGASKVDSKVDDWVAFMGVVGSTTSDCYLEDM